MHSYAVSSSLLKLFIADVLSDYRLFGIVPPGMCVCEWAEFRQ